MPYLLALVLALLTGMTASSHAEPPKPSPTLTISTNNTPLDRQALRLLSEEAFRRAGLELKLVSLPSARSLVAANAGEVDGEGLRIAGLDKQYPDLVQVPERYIGISFVAFARDASIQLDQGWAGLEPYRVSHITGWKLFEANATRARSVTQVETPEQMFRMLDAGRIDLALYTLADGQALVRSLGLSSIGAVRPALKDVDMYLYLHRRHAGLVPQIARALRDMKADGSYNRIVNNLSAQ
jgi:polar amino acid transport system substrate-binding protein